MKAYPPGFMAMLWSVFALLSVSGVLLIPGMLEMRLDWNIVFALPSGSRVWVAALHTLGAFATLVVLGALLPLHIRHGWRRRLHFKSGLILTLTTFSLPLTALGIDYFGDERWSAWSSIVHVVLGCSAALALGIHVILAKRLQARRASMQSRGLTQVATDLYPKKYDASLDVEANIRQRA